MKVMGSKESLKTVKQREEEEGLRRRSLRLQYSSKDVSARPMGSPVEEPHTPQEETATYNHWLGPVQENRTLVFHAWSIQRGRGWAVSHAPLGRDVNGAFSWLPQALSNYWGLNG